MNPQLRKRLITFVVLFVAGLVVASVLLPSNDAAEPSAPTVDAAPNTAQTSDATASPNATTTSDATAPSQTAVEPPPPDPNAIAADADDSQEAPASTTLAARAPHEGAATPASLGSLNPDIAPYEINFSTSSAGIESIIFSDLWMDATYSRQAAAHRATPELVEAPADSDRYTLFAQPFGKFTIPLLGARAVEIDGTLINLFGEMWTEIAPGHFRTEIVDSATSARVLQIDRVFALTEGSYQLDLQQTVANLGTTPLDVRWISYGPGDLERDGGAFIEVRRYHFGYLMNAKRDPSQLSVQANGQMFDRSAVLEQVADGEELDLWPNRDGIEQDLTLSWYGTTNRYFAIAVMAPYAPPSVQSKSFAGSVESVRPRSDAADSVITELHGPVKTIAAGATAEWDMGVYFGPLERSVLAHQEPYAALNLQRIIVYLMSGCCTFCTFTWLADFLVLFLTMIHDYVAFDWALSIVILVVIVRTLLHPLMKRGQVQMLRMGKMMSDLKPEMDAIKKKYPDDASRQQTEQRRLFTERGVNPLGCVGGMLPTVLQMPVWIALYAVLFFAFELRQQSAFFGVFQMFGDWQFLGDLSRPDDFFSFSTPIDIVITKLTGINVLPLLMGVMFYLQQKYMSPPPSPSSTPEQLQQQKMMKIMMVVLFPVMLYQAPSGLTLYILTSSSIGILEGRRIRRHVDLMDDPTPKGSTKSVQNTRQGKKPKTKDAAGRFFANKMEEARKKQALKRRGPDKNFKKRDK